MSSEVILWNVLLEQTFTLTSEILNISDRFTFLNENSIQINEIFFKLIYLDLAYIEKINLNSSVLEKIDIDINLSRDFLYVDNIDLIRDSEQEIFDKIMNNSVETQNKSLDIKYLFMKHRKKMLRTLEKNFLTNDTNLCKFCYLILNSVYNYTFLFKQGYLLGKAKGSLKNFELTDSNKFIENQSIVPSIHLDIVKTFINSLKQKENPQILDISKFDVSFGLLGWLNGFRIIIVDQNESKLEFLTIVMNKYLSLFQNHLIFPPNNENTLKSFICLKDTLPDLKRIKFNDQNEFEGIIANFSLAGLTKAEIIYLLDRLIEILLPNGFLLIQDYFFDSTSNIFNDPKYVSLTKNEFESYLKEKSLRILLRMSDFHMVKKTSYIIVA